jgi:hypothetical protein
MNKQRLLHIFSFILVAVILISFWNGIDALIRLFGN